MSDYETHRVQAAAKPSSDRAQVHATLAVAAAIRELAETLAPREELIQAEVDARIHAMNITQEDDPTPPVDVASRPIDPFLEAALATRGITATVEGDGVGWLDVRFAGPATMVEDAISDAIAAWIDAGGAS